MATKFTPSRNVTSGNTQNTGPLDSTHEVTGTLSITGSLFLNGVEVTSGGGGSAAGNPTEIQFNTGGAFDASSNFTFDGARVTMVTASAQRFTTPNSAIVLAPTFGGGGPGYLSGAISIASSSQTHGLLIMDFAGPPGPPALAISAAGIEFSGSGGPMVTSTGISLRTSGSLTTNNNAIMIGPDFFGEGHASGAILIQSSQDPENDSMSGIFILPAGDEDSDEVVSINAFGLQLGPPLSEDGMYTALNVNMTGVMDPTFRLQGMDHGGGEVVFFGTGSTDIGKLYYLKSDGGWSQADASATGSGHNQLLGMAMGSSSAEEDGMLIRGFYNALTAYSGAYINGGPVYVGTELGTVSGAAPTTADEYVRVVGQGAASGSLIYFNPDATYVELA